MAISEAEVRALRDALPEQSFLRQFMTWIEYTTDAHLAYSLGAGLAILGLTVEEDVEIQFGSRVRAPLFVLLAGPSGDRKTVVAGKASSIVEASRPDLLSGGHDSTQSLLDALCDQPRQLIMMTEMGNWLARTRRGTHLEGMREMICELWDGTRLHRKTLHYEGTVERPTVSILACVAPALFAKYAGVEEMTGGFFSRFCVLHCARERFYPVPPPWPGKQEELIGHYSALLSTPQGPLLGFDREAYQIMWDWSHAIEARRKAEEHEWTHGFFARLPVFALKAAIAISADCGAARQAGGGPWHLGAAEVHFATQIADLFCRSSLGLAYSLAMGTFGKDVQVVLDAVAGAPARTLSTIVGRCHPAMALRRVREVLETLTTSGQLHSFALPGGQLAWSTEAPGPVGDSGVVIGFPGVWANEGAEGSRDVGVGEVVAPWERG